jgi:catechol 2,3-dioxygenase-like lactoylglutathione lyase family enzyme
VLTGGPDGNAQVVPVRRVVLDHVTIGVRDLAASRRFYAAALAPLGFVEQGSWSDEEREIAFGPADHDDFAISDQYPAAGGGHIAFAADTREQVDDFYDAAIAAGGTGNGPPGERPEYAPGYYGAFVLDPDGYNVEAVWHDRRR